MIPVWGLVKLSPCHDHHEPMKQAGCTSDGLSLRRAECVARRIGGTGRKLAMGFAVALAAAGRARSRLAVRLADSASAELGREG